MAYDIHFQPAVDPSNTGFKAFEFGFTASLKVDGFQSLINRWLKVIMTPEGSDPLYPDYGTVLPNLIGSNVNDLTTELEDAITLSVTSANSQVREQDLEGLYPEEERLKQATVVDIQLGEDSIEAWVEIENMAGTRLTIPLAAIGTRT